MTTPALDDALEAAITAWLTDDPDPATQLALTHLRDRARDGDPSALAEITDGQALGDELLRLVDTRRQEVKAADLVRQGALTGLESSVRSVVTAFGKGLQTSHAPQATRNGKIGLIAALGFVGGGLAMLVYALIRRSLARERATRPERLRAASAAA